MHSSQQPWGFSFARIGANQVSPDAIGASIFAFGANQNVG